MRRDTVNNAPSEKELQSMMATYDKGMRNQLDKLVGKSYEYGGNCWALIKYEYHSDKGRVYLHTNDKEDPVKEVTFGNLDSFIRNLHQIKNEIWDQTDLKLNRIDPKYRPKLAKVETPEAAPTPKIIKEPTPEVKEPETIPVQIQRPPDPVVTRPSDEPIAANLTMFKMMQKSCDNIKEMSTVLLDTMRALGDLKTTEAGAMAIANLANSISNIANTYSAQMMIQAKMFAGLSLPRNEKAPLDQLPGGQSDSNDE